MLKDHEPKTFIKVYLVRLSIGLLEGFWCLNSDLGAVQVHSENCLIFLIFADLQGGRGVNINKCKRQPFSKWNKSCFILDKIAE